MQGMADSETCSQSPNKVALAIFKKLNHPVTLKFDDVVYKIKTKTSKSSKLQEKLILKGITGAVLPGEMLAMLGPSGSGKTTLLSALGGRLGGHLYGNITYNGKPFSSSMNRKTGFVTQDDVFYPHLTVSETLIFTALLRLPRTLTKEEKIMQTEQVIAQLGLVKCKNCIMGGPHLRGVSGGEKKRVSIGQEMLINPSLLFLDEPTSGLDSTSSHRIVSVLLELARGGQTVVMAIHQPSSRLFYMFDKVLLLSDGNPMYFGKGREAMDYFSSIGYAPSVAMNPSDFLLDLASGIPVTVASMASYARKKNNVRRACENNSSLVCVGVYLDDSTEDLTAVTAVKEDIVSAYKSNLAHKLKEEMQERENHHQHFHSNNKEFDRWNTTWTEQFLVLLKRDLKERKHQSFSYLKIFEVLAVAFLFGILWWRSTITHLQDQIGLLFYYAMFWGLIPFFEAVFTFPDVHTMLTKERSSSMYRLSSFYMARTISDLPIEVILPTIFVTVTYWIVGLKPTAVSFLETLFVILYCTLVSQSFGIAVGALFMNVKTSVSFGTVLIQVMHLASGFYVQHVPAIISWLKYTSFTYHTYKLLLGSQYQNDEMYPCGTNLSCRVGSYPAIEMMDLDNMGLSIVALGIMFVTCRVTAYVCLIKVGETHP